MTANGVEPSQPFKDLLFGIRRSIRYHGRRQGFYGTCQDLILFVAFLLSTSTIALFLEGVLSESPTWVKLLPSVVTSVLVGIALVYRVGQKACDHANWRRQFIILEQRLAEGYNLDSKDRKSVV